MKKILISLGFLFCFCLIPSASAEFADEDSFPQWAEAAVESVENAGIITGFSDRTFRPDKILNRAEALIILMRMKEIDSEASSARARFRDVAADAWYAGAVGEATARGWIQGFPDGTFRPGAPLNRAEWATILKRAFEMSPETETPPPSFEDVPSQVWFSDAVFSLHKNGLIRNDRAAKFHPEEKVSRAEAAWMVAQILEMPRLMGTSKQNEFSEALRRDTRRVALPRGMDFNPNLQYFEDSRQELQITTNADTDAKTLSPGDDWLGLGSVRFHNELENTITLHSAEFRLRFERTNIGPSRYFEVKATGAGGIEKQAAFSRTGSLLVSGLDQNVQGGEDYILHLSLRAIEGSPFYSTPGSGSISVEEATATTLSTWKAGDSLSGQGNYRSTPIKFESRNLTPIEFIP